jgi:predicted metal-dependent hydrolase
VAEDAAPDATYGGRGAKVRQLFLIFSTPALSTCRAGGLYTPKNTLNFNRRLIKAAMRVIEYVTVHELTHLLEPNHIVIFGAIVKNQLSHFMELKEWLKRAGGLLE